MAVTVEFEYEGRTYEIAGALHAWNIYAIKNLRENISLEIDQLTGQKVFVSWADVGLIRLTSDVDQEAPPAELPVIDQHAAEPEADKRIIGPPPAARDGVGIASSGWYRDPLAGERYRLRYWDGREWTDRVD